MPIVIDVLPSPSPGMPNTPPVLPTLLSPFTFINGVAHTAEQDSVQDVESCVYNTTVCPQGFRDDTPTFGVPEVLFDAQPANLNAFVAAIERWEPRASVDARQTLSTTGETTIVATVEVIQR